MNTLYFNAFTNYLLNTNESKTDIYDASRYSVWACKKGFSFTNSIDLNLYEMCGYNKDYKNYFYYLDILKHPILKNVTDENLENDNSYEKLLNIPCSAYIFSNLDSPKNCYVKDDYNYRGYDYRVNHWDKTSQLAATDAINKDSNKDTRLGYFSRQYGFNSGYSKEEYMIYGVDEHPLCDNVFKVSADSYTVSGNLSDTIFGGLLVTRTNKKIDYLINSGNNTACLHPSTMSGEENTKLLKSIIPVMYYELPKTYKAKNGVVNIDWSTMGLLQVE